MMLLSKNIKYVPELAPRGVFLAEEDDISRINCSFWNSFCAYLGRGHYKN